LEAAFKESSTGFNELLLVTEVLEKGDAKLKDLMNTDVKRFTQVVYDGMSVKGIKWDDIVLRFEWTYEVDAIMDYLNSGIAWLDPSRKQQVLDAVVK
jgi:hypothetical protein